MSAAQGPQQTLGEPAGSASSGQMCPSGLGGLAGLCSPRPSASSRVQRGEVAMPGTRHPPHLKTASVLPVHLTDACPCCTEQGHGPSLPPRPQTPPCLACVPPGIGSSLFPSCPWLAKAQLDCSPGISENFLSRRICPWAGPGGEDRRTHPSGLELAGVARLHCACPGYFARAPLPRVPALLAAC